MSFSEWSNNKRKKKSTSNSTKKATSFNEWSNAKYGVNDEGDDDIAPVKSTKKEEDRTWFKKSEGNVGEAVIGSTADVEENFWSGILGIGEKIVDAGATIFTALNEGSMSQAAQSEILLNTISGETEKNKGIYKKYQDAQDELEDKTAQFVAKDLYSEEKVAKKLLDSTSVSRNIVGAENVERYSVFGEKTDALVQSGGQLVAQLGADALLPGSGMALMGVTSFGSEAENAFNQGATFGEGVLSATVSAGAEMLTEKIGGVKFGGKTLTDVGFGKLSSKMTNKLAKVLITTGKVGVDALAEGGEELLSGYMSAAGQKLSYMKDKEIEELFSNEDKLESFIGGVVLGGAFAGGESLISGRNTVNGMTKNEQAVVDKVYKDAIAKEEQNGKKLSSTEKQKIYDNIVEKMDKGDIDIDTIEEVLGGKTFEEYKSITEQEKALTDEISQLENLPKEQITVKQSERLTEAREELKNITNKTELKTKLSDEVYGIAKKSRLVESYNEKARKSQAFEADLTQYTGKQRASIERAIKSGVLNNTNKSHALVDTLSKIEADKGIIFDYTDNAKLKASGFAIEGKTVNGFEKNGTVTLNVQSAKAWQSTVGHEIAHVLEGTESYGALQDVLFKYAESKGELASRKAALTELYKGIDADIDKELTADLVGDYLFSDKDFINHLTGNISTFKKVYEQVKYLCKVATGKQLTEIEKVKREFDNVWKEYSAKGVAEGADGKVNLSISETTDGRIAAVVDNDILKNIDTTSWDNTKKETAKKAASNALKQFSEGIVVDGITRKVNKTSRQEYTRSNYTESLYNTAPDVFADKMRAADIADDIVVATTNWYRDGSLKHPRNDNFVDFDHGTVLIMSGDAKYNAEVVVGITKNGEAVLYDVVDMTPTTFDIKKAETSTTVTTQNAIDGIHEISAEDIVAENGKDVKRQYSVSEDSQGNELSLAVQKRFANSKAVDENGNLKVLYHGTANGEFYTFDKSKGNVEGDFGSGFYFTDNETDVTQNYEGGGPDFDNKVARRAEEIAEEEGIDYYEAEEMAENELFKGSNVHTVYLNIENPAIVGETYLFEYDSYAENYDREDYDSDEDYEGDVERLIVDDIDQIIWDIERNVDLYSTDGIADVLWNAVNEGGIDIEQLKAKINGLYLEDNNGNFAGNEVTRQIIESLGYDGIIDNTVSSKFNMNLEEGTTHYIVFKPNQIKSIDNQNPTDDPDIRKSLSKQGEQIAPVGNYSTPLNETALAPTKEDIAEMESVTENVTVDIAPMPTDADAPPEMETEYYSEPDIATIDDKTLKNIGKSLRDTLYLTPQETKAIQEIVQEYSTSEISNSEELFNTIKEKFGEKVWKEKNQDLAEVKRFLRNAKINVSPKIKSDIADYKDFRKSLGSKLGTSKNGLAVDVAYQELVEMYPEYFSDDIWNETDQFLRMAEVASMDLYKYESQPLDDEVIQESVNIILNEVRGYKENLTRVAAEETAEEVLNSIAPLKAEQIASGSRGDALLNQSLDNFPIKTVEDKVAEKLRAVEAELADNKQLRRETENNYKEQIATLSEEYLGLKNNKSKKADNIIRRIARLERLKASADADYAKRISDLEARAEKMKDPTYSRAMHKQAKMQEHADWAKNLLGDTSTWKDKKIGLQYATNTERRNLRDIVRDENGNADIAKADAIDDALNGRYNREEAEKKRELSKTRGKYADLKITKAEDAYIQMLGELRGNPDTELTEKVVKEYYEKHKDKIDTEKVEKVIELARQDYDNLLKRVNEKLREQGMKEIPYRQGYFPHFTEPKQNFIQKLLNWKTQDNEIPTSIAGLTEDFKPVKSWQSFDKTRHSDTTDYSFLKGFDTYSEGALDWIYHLDTLQKRRAVENHIRYTHSDEGIQARIKAVYADEGIDATEAQSRIEGILAEAQNPLNNFVQDFTTHTNILAGKKNSLDRTVEQATNRHIYSVMTNVQNRMSANMVLANVRSALTNFIPITQSWAQVSPLRSLQATKDTIANAIKDDGLINKSAFLTNRLKEVDNLYNTTWDKILDKAGIMFEVVDNISSQVIWRSKYNQNLADGMSESAAIKNADQFAENVMAGRSKGNEPTLFNAKNPFVKAFTMFQLEVNNQYGYLFKDVPNDLKAETNHWKLNLAKGYTTAFVGAYVYNALLEQVAGSGAALDPISIIEDLLRDLGLFDDDEEEEPKDVVTNLVGNVVEELPFVGGLLGGGRIPIASALPYGGKYSGGLSGAIEDISEGNWGNIGKEMMNPLLNVGLPVGGGQIKKTVQGLSMFNTDEEHPIAGSYTDSGSLRFPVEDTLANRVQAGIFGQYASKNAREYFDNGYAPLKEKQIQEFIDTDLPIADYWKYREGLSELEPLEGKTSVTLNQKGDYIGGLDLPISTKNILINNIADDRKTPIDYTGYEDYSNFEEFDFATRYPEKYAVLKEQGISVADYKKNYEESAFMYTDDFSWAANNPEQYTVSKAVTDNVMQYKQYTTDLYNIKADKDSSGKSISGSRKEKVIDYVNNLDLDYGAKLVLFKAEYPSDDTYNEDIINYLNNREDLTYDERVTIYTELGFTVKDGYVYWD